jgi:hypothetical protein
LGGTRVAPYILYAKPKGEKEWVFEIQIDATIEYLDLNGKPTSLHEAASVRQTLLSIRISPLQKLKNTEPNQRLYMKLQKVVRTN